MMRRNLAQSLHDAWLFDFFLSEAFAKAEHNFFFAISGVVNQKMLTISCLVIDHTIPENSRKNPN
jgi:hypothetical protein